MAKLLEKTKRAVAGDYYEVDCPGCGAGNVPLVINGKRHIVVQSSQCVVCRAEFPKEILKEIKDVVSQTPEPDPEPEPEPVVPGDPDVNLNLGPEGNGA